MAVAAFDARGDWAADGAVNATQWLRASAGMRAGDAAVLVRRANKLRRLPVTAEAWLDGRLSRAQVDAVLTNVRGDTIDAFTATRPTSSRSSHRCHRRTPPS